MAGSNEGHEGGSQPMMHLQGSIAEAHVQQPMESDNQMNDRPQSDDMPAQGMWDTTVIGSGMSGGDNTNPANTIRTH
jgi:hypothetical protein